jgi:hypothetical protein
MAALAVLFTASPALAQDPPPVVVTGGLDFANQYNFRGIRQNIDGVSIWPFVDVGLTPYRGDAALKTVTLNFGTWNAIHSELDDKWYERDLYATLGFGFSAATLGVTYTNYNSPDDLFATVDELALKLSGPASLGSLALAPYALVAFELTDEGQADAGAEKGTYIELGIAPGFTGGRATIAVPVKVGLSGANYYEFGGEDETLGYFSIGGTATVPLGAHFNIHGGVELQMFGDTVKAYNSHGDDDLDPDGSAFIGSIGLGFAF